MSTGANLHALAHSLWRNAQAARAALLRGDSHQMEASLMMLDWTAHAPGPASLRRCAQSTRNSVLGIVLGISTSPPANGPHPPSPTAA
ncbi:hypothetical protein [Niveispirillum sp.]|uniref:hypothetical protein n=1 Tax=Niveispirillum sp. TaxID=1917217 RepID=UPI001B5B41B1|nr:hypothetical protein [Niveispirillum sp.]MBP7337684.1 hypothetical protein [Niveispirillum sp.]